MAKILLKFETAFIKEVLLEKDITTFGRKADNDIVIDHPAISGHHGKIVKEQGLFHVIDLNSTNGIFLQARKISRSQLKNGDSIHVAKHILEFSTDSDNAIPSNPAVIPPPENQGVKTARTPEEQKELMRKIFGVKQESPPSTPAEKSSPIEKSAATIKIIAGAVDNQTEISIKELVTYIGSSAQAAIKIKGFLAPDLAAAISQRKGEFFLKAVKADYPKVNGTPIHEQVRLESGALIECGGTNMVFYINSDKQKPENSDGN